MAQQGSGYQARYKRILLKLSGEALMGSEDFGIDPKVLDRMALEVGQLVGIGVQVGLVIGGGNLFRGAALSAAGMEISNNSPRLVGLRFRPALWMALSTAPSMLRSNATTCRVRESLTVMFATWLIGVSEP